MDQPTLEELQKQIAELKEKQNDLQKEFIQFKATSPTKEALAAKVEEMKGAKAKVTEKEELLKKLYPDAKAQAKQEAAAKKGQQREKAPESGKNFGALQLNQSRERPKKTWANIRTLSAANSGEKVWFRARVNSVRAPSAKLAFLVLRQRSFTIQAVLNEGGDVTRPMIKYASHISAESLINVAGVVTKTAEPVHACTQKDVEIQLTEIWVESVAAEGVIRVEDASRPIKLIKEQKKTLKEITKAQEAAQKKIEALGDSNPEEVKKLQKEIEELAEKKSVATKYVWPNQKTRLDNRILDLRTQANQAIFSIQSGVCALFRQYLLSESFTEIHSPKILGAASEGGAEVFHVQYFKENACLAQSPQFYKQMAICADFERVFEIGPVFRAEKSFTHRHLCEFVGLDLEMAINEHYHEVLDVLDGLFGFIFEGIEKNFARELEVINHQFPFEKFQYSKPSPRVLFKDGIAMLRAEEQRLRGEIEKASGEQKEELEELLVQCLGPKKRIGDLDDLSTPQEKMLGRLVKAKYGVDFYILDRFPAEVRPFYTMLCPDDPQYTNSYDLFIRTEEICSGSQRVHDPEMLAKRATDKGIGLAGVADYINAFKFGAPPHGGGGVGLERVVMLYLGLNNIRKSSLFPRDPNRLTP